MQDPPSPAELLDAVVRFLKETAAPALDGRAGFEARVAANALEIVGRELEQGPANAAAERDRLQALLGEDGDVETLNARLAARIADRSVDPETPEVAAHLLETARAKVAIDQPRYASYRRLLEN